MSSRKRYKSAFKSLISFQDSSEKRIILNITDKEANRLIRKKQFSNLIFGSDPYEYSELKHYTILKKCAN